MNIILIHPPLDDPTIPYHSTAYLKGHLLKNGFERVSLRDLNAEYVDRFLQPDKVRFIFEEGHRRLSALLERNSLSFQQQDECYRLLTSLSGEPDAVSRAATGLRSPELFLDFGLYRQNIEVLSHYMNLLGALSYPYEYHDFLPAARGRFSNGSIQDLLNPELGERVCSPFVQYFEEVIDRDSTFASTDLFGISIVYDHQLFHAFQLARMLKKSWPSKRIVLGGTAISQLYKYMRDKSRMKAIFALCDAIVIGEGETAMCEIAASGGDLEGRTFTNTITYAEGQDRLNLPVIHYENVTKLGQPKYDHAWDLYLSPERGINYSPTRGCYWNRCTFCDYGLNTDRPTSPWRERKIDQVIEDLAEATLSQGIRYVYFAVDVMAPGYLDRLCDAILESGLDIRWSAELRMERIFSEERTRKMKDAGCICVSFGMESGSQRILDLIDKGTKVEYMDVTMRNFSLAGIACQLMAFTDFPTETRTEKVATQQFIRKTKPYWSTGGLGTFLLTGTSIIAKNPEKFGIELVQVQGVDSPRAVAYRLKDKKEGHLTLAEDSDGSFDNSGDVFPLIYGRPWAGGTDSLHSMIYYNTYGKEFFKQHPARESAVIREISDQIAAVSSVVVNGELVCSSLDLAAILQNRKRFQAYVIEHLEQPIEPTYPEFCRWAEQIDPVENGTKESHWIINMTRCVKIDRLVFQLLQQTTKRRLGVSDLLAQAPEAIHKKLVSYFQALEKKGVISFRLEDKLLQSPEAVQDEERRRKSLESAGPDLRLMNTQEPLHTSSADNLQGA